MMILILNTLHPHQKSLYLMLREIFSTKYDQASIYFNGQVKEHMENGLSMKCCGKQSWIREAR